MTKTERVLLIYHLLTHCKEVELNDITSRLPGCKKTIVRDMRLLKDAGIQIHYSRGRTMAYCLLSRERTTPAYPNNQAGKQYLDKIIRLTTIMDEMDGADDPVVWYQKTFPQVSIRTMQRDLTVLKGIGYRVKYEREDFDLSGREPRRYYCDWPDPDYAYSLDIFKGS